MSSASLSLLLVAVEPALAAACAAAGWRLTAAAALPHEVAHEADHDAVLVAAADLTALQALRVAPALAVLAQGSAVVVMTPPADADLEAELLQLGVQALVAPGDPAAVLRALRHAIERKRREGAMRHAYATDLATGLPHQAQLIEHLTQLLALREREPAPMVLAVLRVDGYAGATALQAPLGSETADLLRRKVAVRLRAALRASDVVAAIAPDVFAVLLGRLDDAADGERVAAKLVRSLRQPFLVAGQPCAVATTVGLALIPADGRDAAALLHQAAGRAGVVAGEGGARRRQGPAAAANDDGA